MDEEEKNKLKIKVIANEVINLKKDVEDMKKDIIEIKNVLKLIKNQLYR